MEDQQERNVFKTATQVVPPRSGFLKVKQAAAYLGTSPKTILRLIKDGKLLALKLDKKSYSISIDDLDRYVQDAKKTALENLNPKNRKLSNITNSYRRRRRCKM